MDVYSVSLLMGLLLGGLSLILVLSLRLLQRIRPETSSLLRKLSILSAVGGVVCTLLSVAVHRVLGHAANTKSYLSWPDFLPDHPAFFLSMALSLGVILLVPRKVIPD